VPLNFLKLSYFINRLLYLQCTDHIVFGFHISGFSNNASVNIIDSLIFSDNKLMRGNEGLTK